METQEEKLKRLEKLVQAQKELINGCEEYINCLPICIREVVKNYKEMKKEIDKLRKPYDPERYRRIEEE